MLLFVSKVLLAVGVACVVRCGAGESAANVANTVIHAVKASVPKPYMLCGKGTCMAPTNGTVRIPTTNGGVTVKCYHVNEDCDVFPEHGRDIPRNEAENRGLSECKRCNGQSMTGEDNDPRKYIRQIEELQANES